MIYLDNNATTPVAPSVFEAMIPYLRDVHGNPSSGHAAGRRTRKGVERARAQVAELIGASPEEIVFTSGGSESNNHVIKGIAARCDQTCGHYVISAVEHPAVRNPCAFLESQGFSVTAVPVDRHGRVDPEDVGKAIRDDTVLVSIMHANNEVGTIQPIGEISAIARRRGVLVHTDAAQSIGKIPVDVGALGVDFLTIAGHKLYAPPGIGALYIRSGIEIEPLIHGAGHEGGRRSGTEGVANIVGLGAAAAYVGRDGDDGTIRALADGFFSRLRDGLDDRVVLNGHPTDRLPNTANVSFVDMIGQEILDRLEGICASPGAACHYGKAEPSAVLSAMGVPREIALGAIRFSLGRQNTSDELEQAAERIIATVKAMRR